MSGFPDIFDVRFVDLGPFQVRPLSPQSAEAWGEILASMNPWLELGFTAEGLRRYLARDDPALHRFEIVREQIIAGVVCIRYPWLRGPFLELIAIADTERGEGIGARVLKWIVDAARPACENIWTSASDTNPRAVNFYRRGGFIETARLDGFIKPGMTEILMRKPITPNVGV